MTADNPDKLLINDDGLKVEYIGGRYRLSKLNKNTWMSIWLEEHEVRELIRAVYWR